MEKVSASDYLIYRERIISALHNSLGPRDNPVYHAGILDQVHAADKSDVFRYLEANSWEVICR